MLVLIHIETRSKAGARGGSTEGVKHMNSVRTMYMDREYRQIQVITIICLRYQL
jgi:hypothetical protein